MIEPHRGIFPIAPTIVHENGDLDIEGNRRVMDLMVDHGVYGVCILANVSEPFPLTNEGRDQVMRLSGAGRRPRAGDRHDLAFLGAHRLAAH